MICQECRVAGAVLTAGYPDQAAVAHSFCDNACTSGAQNWCDCQCKTTPALATRSSPVSTVLIGELNE